MERRRLRNQNVNNCLQQNSSLKSYSLSAVKVSLVVWNTNYIGVFTTSQHWTLSRASSIHPSFFLHCLSMVYERYVTWSPMGEWSWTMCNRKVMYSFKAEHTVRIREKYDISVTILGILDQNRIRDLLHMKQGRWPLWIKPQDIFKQRDFVKADVNLWLPQKSGISWQAD